MNPALLAQNSPPELPPGAVVGLLLFLAVIVIISLAIGVLIAWLIYQPYRKLPREYHTIAPGICFLLAIPIVNIVMPIILGIKLPEAFASYFAATGQSHDIGDAGKAVGMWWGISFLCCLVPLLNIVAVIAGLVLLIMFIIKLWDMARRIDPVGGELPAPGGPTF